MKTGPMFRTSDMALAGASRKEIDRRRRDGERLRRGVWVPKDMDPWGKHDTLAHAVLADLQPSAMLSGPTAAYLMGLPRPQTPPTQIFVRGVTRGSYGSDVKVLGAAVPVVLHDGVRMAEPAMVIADCARWLSARDCLAIADHATHNLLCTVDDLTQAADAFHGRRGAQRVRWVVEQVDPGAESPGETWTRVVLKMLGYVPSSQVVVRHSGRVARVDFLLEDGRTVVEFDGLVKYRSPDEVASEKDRQAWLESLGYVVVRILWKHLFEPEQIAQRLRQMGAVPTGKPLQLPSGWHVADPDEPSALR